ncbi:MAG: DUF2169 domain-containing protein [Enhygromyxa sp.]
MSGISGPEDQAQVSQEGMPYIHNLTPFSAAALPSVSFDDQQLIVVVVAGRFSMPMPFQSSSTESSIAHEQAPVPLADEYRGDPGASSLLLEGQSTHVRLGTDIYLEGRAWAPLGRPCTSSMVGLSVGQCRRTAVVFGDRVWRDGMLGATASSPRPFTSMPLTYERCFGGSPPDASGAVALASEHNPVGRGLFARRRDAIGGLLPNIEDPNAPIASISDRPRPIGFGPVARHWRPRRDYGGTYDDLWQQSRAPLWPKDVDPRVMNAAAPGLVACPWLVGGEPVRLVGLHPDGPIEFSLPTVFLQAKFESRRRLERYRMRLDGLRLEPDDGSFTLYWRAAAVADPDLFELQSIIVRQLSRWEIEG